MNGVILLKDNDNVAVALSFLIAGDVIFDEINIVEPIPFCHKVAVSFIPAGSPVIKFGLCIGIAKCNIRKGEWVHSHNLMSNYKSVKKL